MKIVLQHDLENLKQCLLDTAGITSVTPSIFRDLSSQIYKSTKKQVSDSTLKRIFGFAAYTFQPSLYTLNVLAEFCDVASWAEFCSKNKQSSPAAIKSAAAPTESDILYKASELSQHTLQALKNKSGIPFPLTIPRDFLDEHLEIFLHTEYPVTILTAPAGYGKTIGLCHWVEEQLNFNRRENNGNIILFLSGKVLNRISNQDDLHHWLLALLGIPMGNILLADNFQLQIQQHKFHLIIDSFDSTSFNQEQLDTLYSMLTDVISIYQGNPNFKIILTMRSASWLNFKRELQQQNKFDDCFVGFMSDHNEESNVSLFTGHEIQLISSKIKPGIKLMPALDSEIVSLFGYPLFFQYYYQKNPKNFALNELDIFSTYEVIYNFILDKIYTGRFCTEKVLLIHLLVDNGKFKKGNFCVEKLKVYEDLKAYNAAYQDMSSIGIIREVNFSDESGYTECIEFVHVRILTYCIAAKLVYDNNDVFDEKLIDKISLLFDSTVRLRILKWCIFIALKNKQYSIFDALPRIELVASEKARLIKFLSKVIEQGFFGTDKDSAAETPFDITRPGLFNYFLGMEFISPEYSDALQSLLKLNLQDSSKIWIHTSIAINHVISLNSEGLEASIAALKIFPAEAFSTFHINPLNCLETIYYYLKYNVVKKEALTEITHFCFNPPTTKKQLNQLGSNYVLNLLALHVLSIAGNAKKKLRFTQILHNIHHQNDRFVPEYHFFLLISRAHVYVYMEKFDEATSIYELLMMDYRDDESKFTPYMRISLENLAARLIKHIATPQQITNMIERMANTIEITTYKLFQVNTLAYYLVADKANNGSSAYKTLYFKFIKIMRSNSFNPKSFILKYDELNPQDNLTTTILR
ncbi:hypothetical protein [Mucilaginibacter polytrichastri]|uniref:Uncharacterized protein n=1 Tax=Mucilaginibacter polytrichastri TaxID=1302689 RepID=A0A1Q6A376_9SPHI|nr:hypothetical protein [Mucilaginibacter polytrichastri]OKS88474.1 hypothetical protein RG47T_3941 [Mucilaginibacter polytrichastri]SFT12248.1 hypothetical protein SAMN04487890_111150 [Mucilaginibacter polytrichastri]